RPRRRALRPPIPAGHRPGQEGGGRAGAILGHVHDLQQVRSRRLMPLNDDDVREILRIIDESELDELSIETEGFSLHVRKGGGSSQGAEDARSEAVLPRTASERAPQPPEAAPAAASSDGRETISSPMLGTFYRAEAPGASPFVEVGATVGPDTT